MLHLNKIEKQDYLKIALKSILNLVLPNRLQWFHVGLESLLDIIEMIMFPY